MPSRAASRIATAVTACGITSVFFIDFCNLVYRCGCKSLWNGAAQACNIHLQEAHHCPWCSIGAAGAVAVWLSVISVQCFVALGWVGLPLILRVLLTFAAFPVTAGILALGMGVVLNYWK